MSSKRKGMAVQEASDASSGTMAPDATPSGQDKTAKDISFIKAAMCLAKETGDSSFLRLAHNKPRCVRDSAIVNGQRAIRLFLEVQEDNIDLSQVEAAVDDLKILWSDDPSIDLDPAVLITLANCGYFTKSNIPPVYARAFILEFSQRAQKDGIDEDSDWDKQTKMIDDAWESVQTALGKPTEISTWVKTGREYNKSKGMSGKILLQIKELVDSVIVDADTRIHSGQQELENFESLLKELAEKMGDGADTATLLQDICRVYIMQTYGSMEVLKNKVQSLSKFLEGSLEILQSP